MKIASLIIYFIFCLQTSAVAADYAGQISAYRRAHGLSSVKIDSRLNAVALQQARSMASLMAGAKKVGVASVSNPSSPYRVFWAMVMTD